MEEYFDRQLRALNTPDFNILLSANGEQSYRRLEVESNSSEESNEETVSTAVRNRHQSSVSCSSHPVQNNQGIGQEPPAPGASQAKNNIPMHTQFRFNYYGNSPLLCANWSLYNFGLIALYADIYSPNLCRRVVVCKWQLDFVLPGLVFVPRGILPDDSATNSLARQRAVARSLEQLKAQKVIYSWAATEDAKWAVWHCAHFLSKIFSNRALLSQADHVPWCMYIATLCMWAYEVSQAAQSVDEELNSAPYIIKCHNMNDDGKDYSLKRRRNTSSLGNDRRKRTSISTVNSLSESPNVISSSSENGAKNGEPLDATGAEGRSPHITRPYEIRMPKAKTILLNIWA